MSTLKRTTCLCLAPALLGSALSAHERWVEHDLLRPYDLGVFRTWTPLASVLVLGICCALATLLWLAHSKRFGLPDPPPLLPRSFGPVLVRLATGTSLLILALGGCFAAPDLVFDGSLTSRILLGLTVAATGPLIVGWRVKQCSLLLIGAYATALLTRPFLPFDGAEIAARDVLMYFELLAIFAYLATRSGFRLGSGTPEAAQRSVLLMLQGAIGLNVLVHGVMKLLHPDLPMGVVQNHLDSLYLPIASILPLSEEGFVLCASAGEITIGLMILLGSGPRLALVALAGFAVATAFVFKGEILGHLPRVGAILAMVLADARGLERQGALPMRALRGLRRLLRERAAPSLRPSSHSWSRRSWEATLVFVILATVTIAVAPAGSRDAEPEKTAIAAGSQADAYVPPPASFPPTTIADHGSSVSRGANEKLVFELESLPELQVGRVFSLRFRIRREDRSPLESLDVGVQVGMPRHGHGMPTVPILQALGDGRFELTGCQLNMYGLWTIEIVAGEIDWTVFELRYRAKNAG